MNGALRRVVGRAAGLFLLVVSLSPRPAFGLDPNRTLTQYVHRIWQNQQGLPPGAIAGIFQTHDGYLWLSTQAGLVRFDGVQFTPVESIYPDAPATTWTRATQEDTQGSLWMATNDAGLYQLSKSGSVHYTTDQGLPSNSIQCLTATRDGAMWACTDSGLARIDPRIDSRVDTRARGEKVQVYRVAQGLAGDNTRAVCEDSNGSMWVGGDGAHLSNWNGNAFSSLLLRGLPATVSVRDLLCSGDTIWAGTSDGLVRIRGGEQRLFTVKEGLAANFVFSLARGSDGTIWIGTRNGFSRLRGDTIDSFHPQDGLSQSNAVSMFEDREGSLWVGTKRGLNQFVDGRGVPYTMSEGLPSNESGPILEDRQGIVWAGTLDEGLARYDGHGFTVFSKGLPSKTIYALAEDRDRGLWVGTSAGLALLRDGHVAETYTTRQGLPANTIRSLYRDPEGVLWAGTSAGLASLRDGRFVIANGAPHETVVALAADRKGHVVLATESGVYLAEGSGFRELTQNGASIRGTNALYLDPDGLLWMGLNGGGLRMLDGSKPDGTRLTSYQVRDGLYDGEIYGIMRDAQDRLWMSCSRGIFSVARSELRQFAAGAIKKLNSSPYSPTDALRVIEGQSGVQPGLWETHDGRLWFSTIRGLIALDANRTQPPPGPVAIEDPIVNGQSQSPERIGQMAPGQKKIEFDYGSLSFLAPARTRFRYMLEGYDKDWIDAGLRREAFYTNLPPRNYRFRVMACSADGPCDQAGASVAFALAPFLYQRIWFWPLIAALLAGLAWLGYQLNIRRLRERYDLIVAERSRIARELHDTLIQGFSGITMEMQALAGRLRSSSERETLEEIIRDAANCLRETRQSVAGLRAARGPESGLAKAIADAVREITETKDVRLKLKLDPKVQRLPAEVEYNLLRITSEAVANSVKHSGAHTIEVALQSTHEALRLSVKDDGQGLGRESNSNPSPGHYGIIGMKERASQIGADLEWISEPGSGTTVSLRLPVGHAPRPENVEAVK